MYACTTVIAVSLYNLTAITVGLYYHSSRHAGTVPFTQLQQDTAVADILFQQDGAPRIITAGPHFPLMSHSPTSGLVKVGYRVAATVARPHTP
jgi:hypothetical protein